MRGEEGGGRKAKDCLCGVCKILILFSITQENAGAANENRVMLRSSTAEGEGSGRGGGGADTVAGQTNGRDTRLL